MTLLKELDHEPDGGTGGRESQVKAEVQLMETLNHTEDHYINLVFHALYRKD